MLRHSGVLVLLSGLVALLVIALSLLTSDDGQSDLAVVPSATASATATPASTPSPTAEELARNFTLTEVTGEGAFVTGGAPIPDGLGVYYQDVATGAIEGWSLSLPGTHVAAFSADNRFNVIVRREQLFHEGVIYYEGSYLADRATGKVYWLSGATPILSKSAFNGRNLASKGGRVLFMFRGEQGEEWFTVVDIDPAPIVVTRFRLPDMWSDSFDSTWALFSHDGSKVAVLGRKGYIVEVSAGSATPSSTTAMQFPGDMTLLNVADGASLLAILQDARDDKARWYRIGWNAQVLAEGSGTAIYPSPDGTHVAVFRGERPHESMNWSVLEAVKTEDASPVFRVVGASAWFGGYSGANRWLADNSGFVVSNSALQMSFAMRDGSFRSYVGVPALDSPNRFGQGGSIRDRDGKVIASAALPVPAADFVPPFGESSEEIRYLVPHGGHDCCQGAFSLVESYVEYPPYPSELSFSLSPAASGEQLLDEPLTGRPVGSITGASKVTVLEMRTLCTDPAVMPGSNCLRTHYEVHHSFLMRHQGSSSGATIGLAGFWARVKTADGQEGWLLLSVRILGV
jgi:hypothetical protein